MLGPLSVLAGALIRPWVGLLILLSSLLLSFLIIHSAKHTLHRKGYTWVTFWDALEFYHEAGIKPQDLPESDQMAAIPGYKDSGSMTLTRFMARYQKEKLPPL